MSFFNTAQEKWDAATPDRFDDPGPRRCDECGEEFEPRFDDNRLCPACLIDGPAEPDD